MNANLNLISLIIDKNFLSHSTDDEDINNSILVILKQVNKHAEALRADSIESYTKEDVELIIANLNKLAINIRNSEIRSELNKLADTLHFCHHRTLIIDLQNKLREYQRTKSYQSIIDDIENFGLFTEQYLYFPKEINELRFWLGRAYFFLGQDHWLQALHNLRKFLGHSELCGEYKEFVSEANNAIEKIISYPTKSVMEDEIRRIKNLNVGLNLPLEELSHLYSGIQLVLTYFSKPEIFQQNELLQLMLPTMLKKAQISLQIFKINENETNFKLLIEEIRHLSLQIGFNPSLIVEQKIEALELIIQTLVLQIARSTDEYQKKSLEQEKQGWEVALLSIKPKALASPAAKQTSDNEIKDAQIATLDTATEEEKDEIEMITTPAHGIHSPKVTLQIEMNREKDLEEDSQEEEKEMQEQDHTEEVEELIQELNNDCILSYYTEVKLSEQQRKFLGFDFDTKVFQPLWINNTNPNHSNYYSTKLDKDLHYLIETDRDNQILPAKKQKWVPIILWLYLNNQMGAINSMFDITFKKLRNLQSKNGKHIVDCFIEGVPKKDWMKNISRLLVSSTECGVLSNHLIQPSLLKLIVKENLNQSMTRVIDRLLYWGNNDIKHTFLDKNYYHANYENFKENIKNHFLMPYKTSYDIFTYSIKKKRWEMVKQILWLFSEISSIQQIHDGEVDSILSQIYQQPNAKLRLRAAIADFNIEDIKKLHELYQTATGFDVLLNLIVERKIQLNPESGIQQSSRARAASSPSFFNQTQTSAAEINNSATRHVSHNSIK